MFDAFGLFIRRSLLLIGWGCRYWPADSPVGQVRRVFLLLFGLPVALLLQLMHWCGFLLDELLFPGYRRVKVSRPVFIIGIPRSGTTLLQRTLASDPAFTTMMTWECLLAPSISERYCLRLLARPLQPLLPRLHRLSITKRLRAIHELSLSAPEEDFLTLLPVWSCFIQIVMFPEAAGIRRLAFFDSAVPVAERRLIMHFYHRCLQRHLYFHGTARRYLAKNPSFTSWQTSLRETFADAHIIACSRPPSATVPSQLSALQPSLALFGVREITPEFRNFLIEMLHHYYQQLRYLAVDTDKRISFVAMTDLCADLVGVLTTLYADMEQSMTKTQSREYRRQAQTVAGYRSGHHYRMQDFALDEPAIRQRFSDVWPVFDRLQAAS